MTERAHQGGKVLVEAKPDHRVPRAAGQSGLQGRGRGQLHPVRGRGLRPRGGIGFGKTTIGRAIAGLNRTTGGSLKVLGYEMLNLKERTFKPLRKEIGFVFQDPATSFNRS